MFIRWLVALLIPAWMWGTTLTGTLNNPDGTGANGYLYLSLAQQAALQSTGSCGGPAQIVPVYSVRIQVINGAMQSPPAIYGNDCMLPANTYYNVVFRDNNGNILMNDRWVITGESIDVGTIVSVIISGTLGSIGASGVVMTVPAGEQVVVQPPGTKLKVNYFEVTDTFTSVGGLACTSGGCTINGSALIQVTLDTAQTITGQKSFAADIIPTSGAKVGNASYPWSEGWFGITYTAHHFIYRGGTNPPDDWYVWEMPGNHELQLLTSSAEEVIHVDTVNSPGYTMFKTHVTPDGAVVSVDLGTNDFPWHSLFVHHAVVKDDIDAPSYKVSGVSGATTNLACNAGQAIKSIKVEHGIVTAINCGELELEGQVIP